MKAEILEIVKDLEKFPHIKNRLQAMLSVAKNTSGKYELADDVEEKICEEISEMGRELIEAWGAEQEKQKVNVVTKSKLNLKHHGKKKFIGIQNLEK